MNRGTMLCRAILCALVWVLVGSASVRAQKVVAQARVTESVDDTRTLRLRGNIHPLARAAFDQGALADSQPMSRMLLLLQRSAEQEQTLQQLLDAQQTKGSASYHAWLTPDQFGKQFGPSDADVQAVTDWLARQGFTVKKVAAGRTAIEFDGNVAQVRSAFHTDIHRYLVNGQQHFANASDPAIPAALAPVVAGVVSLHNFPREAHVRSRGVYQRNTATGQLTPLFTYGTPASFAVGPGDFAKIYNIPSGADGTGESIAVVGQSNINTQDVCDFRTIFSLTPACPAYTDPTNGNLKVIVNGPDPGLVSGDEGESDLDVQWAGAIAPAAKIYFVTSQSTTTTSTAGIDLSALYIVDNNVAPVLSESYGSCEQSLGTAGNAFYSTLWQQAAAEGITVVISSGDSGSAGCDPTSTSPNSAVNGLAVSGISSTIYNVSAGGTDFDPSTQTGTYWNTTNGTIVSALQYMPETTWDNSNCAINFPTACNSVSTSGFDVVAGSGGPSNCSTGTTGSCSGYPKPPFQTSITPAAFSTRLQPDVSFFSSNGQNGVALVVCQADVNPSGASCNLNSPYQDFSLVGGTSAATPAFAAVIALVNQKTGQRQGNANFVLYGLAAMDTNYTSGNCNSSLGHTPAGGCVYNDVSKGNIGVACTLGSISIVDNSTSWCAGTGATYGVTVFGSAVAYTAGTGYDLATGLGSINIGNLLNKWSTFSRTATTTTVASTSGGTPSGTNFTATINVTPSSATGSVSLTALDSGAKILGSYGPFTVSGGAASAQTNLLPPGTSSVYAYYGGDVTHSGSQSPTKALSGTVTGANQGSKTTLGFVQFDANNNPILPPITTSASVTYGSSYIAEIAVTNANGTPCTSGGTGTTAGSPCPTGTITLTDNGSPLNDWPNAQSANATNIAKLNNQGNAEDQPIQLSAGTHSLVATFTSGDTNFLNSTSNTLTVAIAKAATTTTVATNLLTIPAGGTVTLTATISSTSNGEATCGITNGGTVQFTNNGTALSGTVSYTPISGATSTTGAGCLASLTTAISSVFPPPTGGPGTPALPRVPVFVALLSLLFFALGLRWIPRSRRRAYAYAGMLAFALLAGVIAGCGGGSAGGSGGGATTRTLGATYSGDTNYIQSAGTTTITVQ